MYTLLLFKLRQYDLPSDGGGVTGTPTYAKDKSNLTCKNTVGKINLNNNTIISLAPCWIYFLKNKIFDMEIGNGNFLKFLLKYLYL
jgi:hypothetical protein